MKRAIAISSAMAIVLCGAALMAQGKNFAGKWTPDTDKNAAAMAAMAGAGGGGGGGGARGGGGGGRGGVASDMTIAMDAKTLTITRTTQAGETKTVYNLDGTDSKITMGQGEAVAKAKWDGDKLVIETTSQGQNGPQVQKVTWYLDGASLVQERAPRQEGAPAAKTFYKKAS